MLSEFSTFVKKGVKAVSPFSDASLEKEFVDFAQRGSILFPSAGFFVIGCFNIILGNIGKPEPNIYIFSIAMALGSIGYALWIATIVLWKFDRFTAPRHLERWWTGICVLWMSAVTWTGHWRKTGFCERDNYYVVWNATEWTKCYYLTIDGGTWPNFAPFLIAMPRLHLVLLVILYEFIARHLSSFAYQGKTWYGSDYAFQNVFVVCQVGFFALREKTRREQFLQNKELRLSIAASASARDAVDLMMQAILPAVVLPRIVTGEEVADQREATVLFSDVASFTKWCSSRTAHQVVLMLNAMYSRFDAMLDLFGVEKVMTIGDAYWACSGLPTARSDHARRVCSFALLAMQKELVDLRKTHAYEEVHIRVGVHTGLVCGGLVGESQMGYQLFGHVNEHAEKMEQDAPVDGVLVSRDTLESLMQFPEEDWNPTPFAEDRHAFVLHAAGWAPQSDNLSLSLSTARSTSRTNQTSVTSRFMQSIYNESESEKDERRKRREVLLKAGGAKKVQQRTFAALQTSTSFGNAGSPTEDNMTDGATTSAEAFDSSDLVALRKHLGESKHTVRMTFANPEVEADYREHAWLNYRRCAKVLAACTLAYHVSCLLILAAEGVPQPWWTYVGHACLALVSAGAWMAAFHPGTPTALLWFRFSLDYWLTLFLTLTMSNPSPLNVDFVFIVIFYALLFNAGGLPGFPWIAGVVWAVLAFTIPFVVLNLIAGRLYVGLAATIGFGPLALWVIALRRQEKDSRAEFLDDKVVEVANRLVQNEHKNIIRLLEKSMPKFVVAELEGYLDKKFESREVISHQYDVAGILFGRSPQFAEQLAHESPDVVMERVSRLNAIYEEQLRRAPSCIKIKVIGDIILVASGLPVEGTDRFTRFGEMVLDCCVPLIVVAKNMELAVNEAFCVDFACGIHVGPVVGGVLGVERIIYDVFGDTVNTASRVASTSGGRGVWLSQIVRDAVLRTYSGRATDEQDDSGIVLGPEMQRTMKGKGQVSVYEVISAMEILTDDKINVPDDTAALVDGDDDPRHESYGSSVEVS